jgi:uncharacterized protein (TIGR02284 family)
MSNNQNTIKVLGSLIQVLHDGHQGMSSVASQIQHESAKRFLLEQSQLRAEYAAELENELHRLGVHDVKEGGTAIGTAQRIWGDIKAKMGAGDASMLETVAQEEEEASRVYSEAIDKNMLPGDVRDMLRQQSAQILASLDTLRELRAGNAQ